MSIEGLRRLGTFKVVFRVYLLGVTVVVVLGAAMVAMVALQGRPAVQRTFQVPARYWISRLVERLDQPDELLRESRLQQESGAIVTVFDRNGRVLVSSGEHPLAPLPEALLSELEAERSLVFGSPPKVAIAVTKTGALQRYGIVEMPVHPRPPAAGIVIGAVLLGLAVVAFIFARTIVVPLRKLAEAARALGSGDLETRVQFTRRDEFGDVGRAFDDMAERVTRLVRTQQELLANVSHELRSPLARIRVSLDLGAEGDIDAKQSSLAAIAEDLVELESMVGDILTAARLELGKGGTQETSTVLRVEETSLTEVIERAASRFRKVYPDHDLDVQVANDVPHTVSADPSLLQRVVDNLLDNAGKYSEPKTQVTMRVDVDQEQLVFEIEDKGIGIEEADLARLFTAFFRTDRSRSRATGGVGLGLCLAKSIVEAHGGTIDIMSKPGAGTTLRFQIPARSRLSQL